jgi:transcriptional regulator with XRE-family HTH domain
MLPIVFIAFIFIILNIWRVVLNTTETGKIIRERRRVLGIDQRTAAELSGVSAHTFSDIESGKGNPTVKILCKVLDALGLEMRIQIKNPQDGEAAVPPHR